MNNSPLIQKILHVDLILRKCYVEFLLFYISVMTSILLTIKLQSYELYYQNMYC